MERKRKQCVLEGLVAAPERKVQLNRRKRKLDVEAEATLAALACSVPLDGRARWMLKLLCNRLVELKVVDSISNEKEVLAPT